ncbi:GH14509 [Drosophila grimshawi]|uniref:GH14509 n=1 Tax=Drosophila grimshawi TaxID=7222 RepID=B4IZJ1_DROGR|nr:GH14509 [Drosophila grimshawi]
MNKSAAEATNTASNGSSDDSCLFTFDAHQYLSFPTDPYASSKYGSQVRERKIDRCLKQLQDALKIDKSVDF